MKHLITLTTILVLGTLTVRTQQPNPYTINGKLNGLQWRGLDHLTKAGYADGLMEGVGTGVSYMHLVGGCNSPEPFWFDNKGTVATVVSEMDAFYEDGANLSMPQRDAYLYSESKLSPGMTKERLDTYLRALRQGLLNPAK